MIQNVDVIYNDVIQTISEHGEHRTSRAGDTIGMFDLTMKFDIRESFPLISGKKINFDNVYAELMWFIRGDSNIKTLRSPQLWQPWADENGDCGRIYGVQWRDWQKPSDEWSCDESEYAPKPVDQLSDLITKLKTNPTDRRLVVSAWNAGELDQMALPPCHMFFQCYVSNNQYLDLSLWQRSCDMAIGVPYNIASYALLLKLLAKEANLEARYFNHHLGDAHIYTNHVDNLKKQIERPIKSQPALCLLGEGNIFERAERDTPEDYSLVGYDPHPFLKFEVAV